MCIRFQHSRSPPLGIVVKNLIQHVHHSGRLAFWTLLAKECWSMLESQFWRSSTCRQRSTRSTMQYYSDACNIYLIRFHWHCNLLVWIIFLRSKTIRTSWFQSVCFTMVCWNIPQGLVCRPIRFIMYTLDTISILEHQGLLSHLFTDKYESLWLLFAHWSGRHCSQCTGEILNWMQSNRLQLNTDKTEFIGCASPMQFTLLSATPIRVSS